ncbi:phospholipid/cholesterol/gamma-HCH transport system substrate-binding protein [Novosphingobium capsulatum]|uniref:Phospholipid/cholesterol/gamma-HCH transport system substrate-binding protein n=1 Tax=Novosphingobium capsulatum TaxID=13688 RepID=A0ABU1MNP6_9SPHN|nr:MULTISPECIES: MlaD family protein [Novosphingobium]KPF53220.1 mammalian cell entry protein [Novosphingobium sp. AAP1]MBB3359615.1 phospholipid/cholesterol/gamma-HCH transport system substrate-binding protein [Novosphingobium sp. BK256]MBB3376019.1 phospholipid/cholesterol/gamma-HCH transport system substrate-binding protein [Novosphingobium sp. BK280]MBB3380388.1 phospholipid/cholesterol/gamma-HCH transport system substrate-binding protein [Novosphingobium sp. BK258]MBB3422040.1 phospholipi
METRANHIWVGAVTLLLLIGAAVLTIWIARLNQNAQNEYDIFFKQSVDGLAKGSEVSFSGVPSGQVKDIELWEKDPEFVRVRIAIDKRVPILMGTTASIQGSFTGVSTIQLAGAVKGAPPIDQPGPEGAPVIPTKRSGLGEILSNAPLLLERLATLTERLTMVLSDKNQKSIENILAHTDKMTANLADASPQVQRTLAELQSTLRQATYTLSAFEKVAGSADNLLNDQGNGLAKQLRDTLKSAQAAADALNDTAKSAQPGLKRFDQQTLPAADAALRDLQATTRSLRELTDRINDRGVSSVVGSPKLPDYKH